MDKSAIMIFLGAGLWFCGAMPHWLGSDSQITTVIGFIGFAMVVIGILTSKM